ncbi:MAG: two-component regulator propeller domain-containing protein, partial [bacterium]|nr:two-component regulator propeller domain-containing protein [bacterium]
MIVDKYGNLWFGTHKGISKYDGVKWTSFTTKDGLIDNRVRAILEDSIGNLWVGTENGVSCYYDEQRWQSFTMADGLAGSWVSCLMEDQDGHIWCGTGHLSEQGGVSRLTTTALLARDYLSDDPTLLYPIIYRIFQDAKDPAFSLKELREFYKQEHNELRLKSRGQDSLHQGLAGL